MGALKTFPVSFKVAGRRILVVGGGVEALNKARLLAHTCAQIVVVSETIAADFAGSGIRIEARRFEACDLDGVALVFVADSGAAGAAAITAARARRIPVNVVDRPEECDFFTPSIVDRAPLTVAISSDGQAPVLARMVRARIEALLGPETGALAALAGAMRERVGAVLGDSGARRHFYEALLDAPAIAAALAHGNGRQAAEALLNEHIGTDAATGIVHLVGAGPGAEDLLTLRGQRILQQADVIVYDRLVPEAVVALGRRDAERIEVDGAPGRHSVSQAQINTLIVRLGREGKRVARLRSGDSMGFERVDEEIAALSEAGIAYAIVPGVSAACAAAETATLVTWRGARKSAIASSGFTAASLAAVTTMSAILEYWRSRRGGANGSRFRRDVIPPKTPPRVEFLVPRIRSKRCRVRSNG